MMYSDRQMRSDEVAAFFRNCLHEQGLESASVTHQTNPETFLDEFYIHIPLTEKEKLSYKTTFDFATQSESVKKRIVIEAEQVAHQIKEKLVTVFNWDNRSVEVSPYNGGWAKCQRCGTKVDAPKAQYLITSGCELSDPMPVKRNMSKELDNMEPHQKISFKLYLIGLLRRSCDKRCPHSIHKMDRTKRFI